jgi:hypothetical protein
VVGIVLIVKGFMERSPKIRKKFINTYQTKKLFVGVCIGDNMAHPEQRNFCEKVLNKFPEYFKNKRVLDVGSFDVNGNNRFLFTDCEYIGIDVGAGTNVDIVCKTHELDLGTYDVIISTECFEHDMFYPESF